MNREVESSGMGVKVATLPFELQTQGARGYKDTSYLPSGTDGYEMLDGELASGTLTTLANNKIEWLVSADYDANNYTGSKTDSEIQKDEDDGKLGIRPGNSGSLHFWIVPRDDTVTSLDLKYTLNVTAFKKVYKIDGEGNVEYDSKGNPVEMTPVALTESEKDLKEYVDCHILFFRYKGDDPAYNVTTTDNEGDEADTAEDEDDEAVTTKNTNDKYSKLIDDTFSETVTFTDSDGDGHLDPTEITIYWIWPETFGEAVLTDELLTERKAVCMTETVTENDTSVLTNELLTKFNKNPGGFLKGYSFPNGTTSLTQAQIKEGYSAMSIQYNNTDQDIGENISYILAEMTVDLDNGA